VIPFNVVAGGKDRALSCLMNSPRPALGANVTSLAERVLERADRLSISSLNHADTAECLYAIGRPAA
jgi:hypothetical protein